MDANTTVTAHYFRERADELRLPLLSGVDIERRRRDYLSAVKDVQRIGGGFDRAYFGHVDDYARYVEWVATQVDRITARPVWRTRPDRCDKLRAWAFLMVHGGREYAAINAMRDELYLDWMHDAMAAAYTIGRMNRETVEAI